MTVESEFSFLNLFFSELNSKKVAKEYLGKFGIVLVLMVVAFLFTYLWNYESKFLKHLNVVCTHMIVLINSSLQSICF